MSYIVKLAQQPITMELSLPDACPGCSNPIWHKHGGGTRRIVDCAVTLVPTQRYRCQACGKTVTMKPLGVDGTYRSQSFQALCVVLYSLGLSLRNLEAVMRQFGYEVDHATCWRDVQRLVSSTRSPGLGGTVQVMYWDEAHMQNQAESQPVEVVIDLQGRLLRLHVTGPDFDWKAWRSKLVAWNVELVELMGAPAIEQTQDAHVVHVQCTLRRARLNGAATPAPRVPPG